MLNKEEVINTVKFWADVVGLGGWDIKVIIANKKAVSEIVRSTDPKSDPEDLILGAVIESYPTEQVASIVFDKDADKEFGMQLCLDTLVLHELIHVAICDKIDRLPKVARNSPRVKELEEWACDFFARKIFNMYKELNE